MNGAILLSYITAPVILVVGVLIFRVTRKKIEVQESSEAMYERATRWQQQILKIDDMLERVNEDEKWCQYVEKIKDRKNGLRKV